MESPNSGVNAHHSKMHAHWEAKMGAVEAKLKKSFSAIKKDMERIEKSKRPELTVSPVDYKLRTDFMAFRNSILQEIDLIKETLLTFKQYNAESMPSSDFSARDSELEQEQHEEQVEELAALRDDIRELAEIIVKKQKKYDNELSAIKESLGALESKKKK